LWKRQFGFFGILSHRQSLNLVLCRCDRMGQLQSIVHRRSRNLPPESFPDLSNFPPEVAVCVLSHLNATDLCLAACVWKHLADNELLWHRYVWIALFSFLINSLVLPLKGAMNWNCGVMLIYLTQLSDVYLFKPRTLLF